MAIQWLSKPEERIIMTPGKPWEYCLPLACAADMPLIEWSCDPKAADVRVDANDSRKVAITLPLHLEAYFGEITYCIHDPDQLYRGRIKVLVQRRPMSSEKILGTALMQGEDAAETPGAHSTATPVVATPTPTGVLPAKSPDAVASPGPTVTHIAVGPHQRGAESGVSETGQSPSPLVESGPPLTGDYAVEVLRRGVRVAQLFALLRRDRTITIGRSSRSHGIPDFDLRGQFETEESEEACSRRQAEVFWSEEHVFIKTVGRNVLRLLGTENQPETDIPLLHCWQPGQTLVVPGGLHLVLKRQRP